MVDEVIDKELVPIMPYPKCPHCGSQQILSDYTYAFYEGSITCGNCKGLYEVTFGDRWGTVAGGLRTRLTDGRGVTLLSPPKPLGDETLLIGLSSPPIPGELYRDFGEAVTGLATSPPRLVAVHCRYIVQRALVMKHIPDKPVQEMINIARQKSLLSEMALQSCRAAAFIGGKGAHPQEHWMDQVGPDDAKQAVLVTKRVIQDLFNPGGL